jgi:hypothetical protein
MEEKTNKQRRLNLEKLALQQHWLKSTFLAFFENIHVF